MQDTSLRNKRRRYARSSSFMMALLFTVLCGAVALTLGYFINYFAKGHFVHSTQAVLDSEIRYIELLGRAPDNGAHKERLYIPLDDDGSLPDDFPKPDKILTEGLLVFSIPQDNTQYAARIHTFDDGRKVLVGTDITEIAHDFNFMQLIGIASIAFVMIVVFVSYLISIFVVNGTNKIAETAYDIIRTGDLSRRVNMHSRWDDLGNVAVILNMLFDRVEELMRGVRQVSDNIAHDLRTPLTRMRSHIESLQKQKLDEDEYGKLLHEADQILNTFNALLRISRIETEQQRSQFTQINLEDIIRDVTEFYEPLAEEKNIKLALMASPAPFYGDRDLLFQAFANILDNAIKYGDENGQIKIDLQRDDTKNIITFENTGAHIPQDALTRIFDRFYRTDESRNKPGAGLGLSLVQAVVTLHGGAVSAQNTDSGVKIITYL